MTNEEFMKYCAERGIDAQLHDGSIAVNGGYVDLGSLTTLPEGMRFENGGSVDLDSLTTLPEGMRFENGGYVDLKSLTTLPEGMRFENGGYVYLGSLTTLPEGMRFENGGYVDLGSLSKPSQTYLGQPVSLRVVDGLTMLMGTSRRVGDVTLHKARYFGGGAIEKLRECYIAEQSETFAHGETAKEAMRDLRFKIAQADYDVSDLVEVIKQRGTVRWEDFRLITGACSEGLRVGMQQAGLDPEADELPLNVVLKNVHGPYGDAFKEALA